jgi:hypothetical protein
MATINKEKAGKCRRKAGLVFMGILVLFQNLKQQTKHYTLIQCNNWFVV